MKAFFHKILSRRFDGEHVLVYMLVLNLSCMIIWVEIWWQQSRNVTVYECVMQTEQIMGSKTYMKDEIFPQILGPDSERKYAFNYYTNLAHTEQGLWGKKTKNNYFIHSKNINHFHLVCFALAKLFTLSSVCKFRRLSNINFTEILHFLHFFLLNCQLFMYLLLLLQPTNSIILDQLLYISLAFI